MLRKRKHICTGSIAEKGFLLSKFCNANAVEGDCEIYPYNNITCHSYNYRSGYCEYRHNPEPPYCHCIASDLKTCFTYAKKHGLRILRAETLGGKFIWKKTMEEVEAELFGGPCPCDESNLEWEEGDP